MAYNHSATFQSPTPSHILDYFWSFVENCTENGLDHSDRGNNTYEHSHRLSGRIRPQMLANFSPSREEGTKRNRPYYMYIRREEGIVTIPEHYKHITSASSLARIIQDDDRIHDLEAKLKAVAEVRDLQMKANAIKRVGEWQLEQLKLLEAEKSLGDRKLICSELADDLQYREDAPQNTAQARNEATLRAPERSFETVRELLQLQRDSWKADRDKWEVEKEKWEVERDKWKIERHGWKVDRQNWKLACKNLLDQAEIRDQQLTKLTMDFEKLKEELPKLATPKSEGIAATDLWDLKEELRLQDKKLVDDFLRGTEARLSTIGNLERPADDTCGPLPPTYGDKSNGKYSQADGENGVLQEQHWEMKLERERWQAESAKLRAAESEIKKLEEVCKDLLERVDQQNDEIRRSKADLEKASRSHAEAQQQIMEHKEEITKLTKLQVSSECIICTNEFGEYLDQQRAYWKDCNHANICYKCTKTLWSSNSRNCPSCKTLASNMPTRLPPKIYL